MVCNMGSKGTLYPFSFSEDWKSVKCIQEFPRRLYFPLRWYFPSNKIMPQLFWKLCFVCLAASFWFKKLLGLSNSHISFNFGAEYLGDEQQKKKQYFVESVHTNSSAENPTKGSVVLSHSTDNNIKNEKAFAWKCVENADSIIPLLSLNGLLWAEQLIRTWDKKKLGTCMSTIVNKQFWIKLLRKINKIKIRNFLQCRYYIT